MSPFYVVCCAQNGWKLDILNFSIFHIFCVLNRLQTLCVSLSFEGGTDAATAANDDANAGSTAPYKERRVRCQRCMLSDVEYIGCSNVANELNVVGPVRALQSDRSEQPVDGPPISNALSNSSATSSRCSLPTQCGTEYLVDGQFGGGLHSESGGLIARWIQCVDR